MAAYNRDLNCIYIHVYRTGGNTLRRLLSLMDRKAEIGAVHAIARDVKEHFQLKNREKEWDNAFKFVFVRNPFSWLVSTYNLVRACQIHSEHDLAQRGFPFYLRWMANVGLHQTRAPLDNRHALLTDFCHDADGQLLVDHVARFEDYEREVRAICTRLGRPVETVLKINRSIYQHDDWRQYYGAAEIALVERVWARDLETFGYSFG